MGPMETMDAIDALISRVSIPQLVDPAPDEETLQYLFQAATRAADHACLQPFRFLSVEGEYRHELGDLYQQAALKEDPTLSDAQLERIRMLPLRAPLVLIAIAHCQQHPKVPEIEQIITAGAAVQNLITAAFALGVGAYWRTGSLAYSPEVQRLLKMSENEKIVGFIYLGTPAGKLRTPKAVDINDFYRPWQGQWQGL